jgi:polar amino acid transport system permease protein
MVRGVPDIIFFLFALIALDQGIEYLRHIALCPDWSEPIRQGNDFRVCPEAKMPLGNDPQWMHEVYGFFLAMVGFAVVFGAFAANTLYGALAAVPHGQLETGLAFGMSPRQIFRRIHLPQMWVYALPGLSNLWMILIKATPLLFLLGVEDIVYWARELGGSKTSRYDYPHPDWRLGYFIALLVFYLFLTWFSEKVFARLNHRVSRGQATMGGTV